MEHLFVQVGCDAKYQVAQLIAELFKEISWRAQPRRKAWHSESYHTVIFDECRLASSLSPRSSIRMRCES